jgi:hypothetical protein
LHLVFSLREVSYGLGKKPLAIKNTIFNIKPPLEKTAPIKAKSRGASK